MEAKQTARNVQPISFIVVPCNIRLLCPTNIPSTFDWSKYYRLISFKSTGYPKNTFIFGLCEIGLLLFYFNSFSTIVILRTLLGVGTYWGRLHVQNRGDDLIAGVPKFDHDYPCDVSKLFIRLGDGTSDTLFVFISVSLPNTPSWESHSSFFRCA